MIIAFNSDITLRNSTNFGEKKALTRSIYAFSMTMFTIFSTGG